MRKLVMTLLAIAGLGAGGMVVAQTIGSVSNGYIEEGNLVRAGNIIRTITMSNRGQDASTCRAACDADSNCYAYTYQQTASNRKPQCLLRMIALPGGATRSHGYTQAVSGTKLSFIPDVHSMTPHPGRAMTGGTVKATVKMTKQDPIACSDICYRDGNCTGFTYYPAGGVTNKPGAYCFVYSQNGTLSTRQQAGFLSGSKAKMTVGGKTRPVFKPTARPTLKPKPRPVIDRTPTQIIPDKLPAEKKEDDGGDDSFPGEMLGSDE